MRETFRGELFGEPGGLRWTGRRPSRERSPPSLLLLSVTEISLLSRYSVNYRRKDHSLGPSRNPR